MPKQGKTTQRNKAKENNLQIQTRSAKLTNASSADNTGEISDLKSVTKDSKTSKGTDEMAEIQEKNLIDKMTKIMKVALNEALEDMKKLIASEVSGITLTSEENVTKLKQDVNTKFKSLEGKLNKQKTLADKVPKLEKSVTEITDILTDQLFENLKSVNDELPKIQQMESKLDLVQEGHDGIEKSLGFLNEDTSSNKADMEKLERMIRDQQKSINKLINENKKLKKKFENLQELVNTLDNRQRKYNLIFEGVAENFIVFRWYLLSRTVNMVTC